MTNGNDLPPGFTGWPETEAECQALVNAIGAAWENRPGKTHGKHWALQVVGNNPLSGYRIIIKQCGANDP